MPPVCRRAALASLLCVLLAAPDARPQQPPPTFGASTDVVLIDLIATDGEGRPVTDLKAEEVEVYEDGKRQKVEFVRFVGRGGAALPTSGTGGVVLPSGAAPAGAPAEALSLVVVVDMGTMPADAVIRTREAITRMVRNEIQPGTRLMLVVLDRGMWVKQGFTTDVPRFLAAVQAIPPPAVEAESAVSTLVEDITEACAAIENTPAVNTPGGVQGPITAARVWVENVRFGMTTALDGIGALARHLSAVPGRKHVVFYSTGYPMDPAGTALLVMQEMCRLGANVAGLAAPSRQPAMAEMQASVGSTQKVDAAGLLRTMLDEANRAQVSVYTVDARGLMGEHTPAQARSSARLARGGAAQQVQQATVSAPQAILYSMAEGTGGRASINTNELARGMRAAVADASGYYLVAYAPPAGRKEGRFYPIEVKATRPGLELRYRKGYEWVSEARRGERAMLAALRFQGLYGQEGLTVEPYLENGKLNVAVILPTRNLEFLKVGAEYRNDITLQALLRDEKGKTVGDRYLFAKSVAMKLTEARYADLRGRENIEIPNDAPLPKKGRYQVTVVARHSGGRLASASADVVIP